MSNVLAENWIDPFSNIEGNTVSEKRPDRQISFEYYALKSYKQNIYSL